MRYQCIRTRRNHRMAYHFRVFFKTKNTDYIREIKRKFNIMGISVNGMANVRCNAELAELLRECERRGFIIIREERYEHNQ